MNRLKPILFLVMLALIGTTAGVLAHAKANQKLGAPGVKTRPLAGSQNLEVLLPEILPGYSSEARIQANVVTNMLPRDTSYGQRLYTDADGFKCLVNVVLMGSSRASIHQPQICLTGQGWNIDDDASREEVVHLDRPVPYDLPVMRLMSTQQFNFNGGKVTERGIYVYWFVDADRCTASHARRGLWSARDVMLKGELDRWAYVAFFAECAPGQEQAALDRMRKLIAAAVPEFQLVPRGVN